MTLPIVFLPEARAEFDEDANWYENRQLGLGKKFTLAVSRVLNHIAKRPHMHAIVLEDVRALSSPASPIVSTTAKWTAS